MLYNQLLLLPLSLIWLLNMQQQQQQQLHKALADGTDD